MATIPSTIQIGAFTFNVSVDQAYLDRHAAQRGEDLAGYSEFDKQRITVSESPGEDYTADTILHEVLHMVLRVVSCSIDQEVSKGGVEDIEERMIDALTGTLLDTLRRNPELVTYFMKKDLGY